MSNNVLRLVSTTFQNPIADLIQSYEGNDANAEDNFKTLVGTAVRCGCTSRETLDDACWPGELEVLEFRASMGEDVCYYEPDGVTIDYNKGKQGYKVSKITTKSTYSSNKAVVGKALDAGVPLLDSEGNPVGKTALEKAVATTKPEKSIAEKLDIVLETLDKLYGQASSEEQDRTLETLHARYFA